MRAVKDLSVAHVLNSRAWQPQVRPSPPRVPSHAVRRGRIFCKRFISSVFPTPVAPNKRHIPLPTPPGTISSVSRHLRPALFPLSLDRRRLRIAHCLSGLTTSPGATQSAPSISRFAEGLPPRGALGDAAMCACARWPGKPEAEVGRRASSELGNARGVGPVRGHHGARQRHLRASPR